MSVPNTWQYRPNWATPIIERLEWRTDVQQGYTGEEDRYALRSVPRRAWSWEMTLQGYERQRFEATFWANASGTWLVPLWWDVSNASFAVGASNWTRSIVPDDRELPAGQYLVVSDAEGAQGFGPYTITPITIGGLPHLRYSWIGAVSRVFPRAKVHPARLCRVTIDSIANVTAGVATYTLTAEATSDAIPGETAGSSVFGTTEFIERPERSEPIDQTWDVLQERVDFGGAFQYYVRRQAPIPSHAHRLVYASRADVYRAREKLHYLKGRYRRVAVPTYGQDLIPLEGLVAGAAALDVRAINWTGLYSARPGRSRIVVRDRAGAYRYATIASASIAGDVETLVLSLPWASSVALEDIRTVSWVELARLDSDAIEIVWTTPEVAQMTLPWRVAP